MVRWFGCAAIVAWMAGCQTFETFDAAAPKADRREAAEVDLEAEARQADLRLYEPVEFGPFQQVFAPTRVPVGLPRPKDPYLALRHDIDFARRGLALRRASGETVTGDGASAITSYLPALMNRWLGTKWSYSGTSQVPKQGKIACGYFVSTVLEHAGFEVDRVDLARQPSEQIIRTLVPDENIERFRMTSRDRVVKRVEELGTGVYIVGLDTHVGFLVNASKEPVKFCHSTRRYRRGVVCEVARTSESLQSRYTVLGKLAEPATIDAWLAGSTLPAARKGKAQPDPLLGTALGPALDGSAEAGLD